MYLLGAEFAVEIPHTRRAEQERKDPKCTWLAYAHKPGGEQE